MSHQLQEVFVAHHIFELSCNVLIFNVDTIFKIPDSCLKCQFCQSSLSLSFVFPPLAPSSFFGTSSSLFNPLFAHLTASYADGRCLFTVNLLNFPFKCFADHKVVKRLSNVHSSNALSTARGASLRRSFNFSPGLTDPTAPGELIRIHLHIASDNPVASGVGNSFSAPCPSLLHSSHSTLRCARRRPQRCVYLLGIVSTSLPLCLHCPPPLASTTEDRRLAAATNISPEVCHGVS